MKKNDLMKEEVKVISISDKDKNIPEENKMGTMPMGKLIFTMSIPAIISMIIASLYNIVDSIFVGMLGENAFAAVTLIFPIQMLIISVGVGTGVGLNSLIARRLGERNFKEANSAATHGVFLAIFSGVLFAIFGIFFSRMFVSAYSDSAEIVNDATIYCSIVCAFSVFCFIQFNVERIMQGSGNMIFPMISTIVGAVINIILDPILIFGLFGMPKMGVGGAAVATVIGQALGMATALFFAIYFKHEVKIKFKGFKLHFGVIQNIYAVGFPAIVMQAISSVMLIGLNAILISYSNAAVAVLGAYFRLQTFIFMPVFGINQGAMPIMGYNYGAQNKSRLIKAYKMALIAAIVIMTIGTLIFQIFPREMLLIFSASDEMLEIGVTALRAISWSFIPAAFGIISACLFQATGHGVLSMITSLLRQLILILPICYILSKYFGLEYFWYGFPLAEIGSLLSTVIFLRLVYVKQIKNM